MKSKFTESFFLRSALFITFLVFISKILGLIKQQYIFYLFHSSIIELDAFIGALRIPNALRELLAEGALSSSFISILAYIKKENSNDVSIFIYDILIITLLLNIVFIVLSLTFSFFFFHFYHYNAQYPISTIISRNIFQVLIPYLSILSFCSIVTGILNSYHLYITPYLSLIFFNITFLVFVYFSNAKLEIYSLPIGLVLGSITQFFIQFKSLNKVHIKNFKFYTILDRFKKFRLTNYIKDFISIFLSLSMIMVIPKIIPIFSNIYTDSIHGANTSLNQAFFLLQIPISIFITGISTITLSRISEIRNQKDNAWIKFLIFSLSITCRVILPISIIFAILSKEITQIFYQDLIQILSSKPISKEYTNLILNIATCLFYASPSLISNSMNIILVRVLQSRGSKKVLIQSSLINLFVSLLFIPFFIFFMKMSFYSIAISITIGSFFQSFFLFKTLFFCKEIKRKWIYMLIKKNYKPLFSTIIMGIFLYYMYTYSSLHTIHLLFKQNIIYTSVLIILSSLFYIFLLILFDDEELFYFLSLLKVKKKKILHKNL